MILIAFMTLVETGVSLVVPWIYRMIINIILDSNSGELAKEVAIDQMYTVVLYLVVIFFITNFLGVFVNYYSLKLRVRGEELIRRKFFEHLSMLAIDFFENEKIGSILNKMRRGVMKGANFVFMLSNWMLAQLLTGITAIIVLTFFDPVAGLIVIIAAAIYSFTTYRMVKRINPLHKKINKKQDVIGAHIHDVFTGMHTVRSFAQEEKEVGIFKSRNKEYSDLQIRRDFIRRLYFFGRITIMDLAKVIILVLAGFKALRGEISAGDIMIYAFYMNYITQPLYQITFLYDEGNETMRAIDDIIEILEIEPGVKDKKGAKTLKNVKGEVVFKNVSFKYTEDKKVLTNVSFKANQGESVAIVGPSGTGKTTITKLISRLYDVSSGEITIDGENIKKVTQNSLRKNIGVVMQDSMLFNDTIKNNICYGTRSAGMKEVEKAAKVANIHDFIRKLPGGYKTLVGERGIRLSGGEKQRVAIARAILKNPPILILDEATSSLDSHSEQLVQEALWKLIKGRTTIIIAHRLSTVMKADKIIVFDKGKIIEEGNHRELMKKDGLYAKLFNIQSGAMLLAEEEEEEEKVV